MISLLATEWAAFEATKTDFLDQFATWSEDALVFAPNGGWNALMVIEHIITSETGTLEYIRRKTQAPALELDATGEREAAAAQMLFTALRSTERWTAPEILPDPSGKFTLAQLQYGWNGQRAQWESTLKTLPLEYSDKAIFKHPRAGRMGMRETLQFLTLHIVHHGYQIDRIREAYLAKS